jgi:hypothetical protein
MGGTRRPEVNYAGNLVLLCQDCHLWIETHRAEARAQGWLVSQWDDPARIPLNIHGLPVWLAHDGKAYPERTAS